MADNETTSPKQNKDVTGDITPSTHQETEQATDSKEHKDESPTDDFSLTASPHQPDNPPSGEVDKGRDDHSSKREVDTPSGVSGTTSNEECGDNSTAGSGKTNYANMQDVTGDITRSTRLETKQATDSDAKTINDQERKDESPTEESDISHKTSPHQPDHPPSGEVKGKGISNLPTDAPPQVDTDRDDHSSKTEVDTPGGADGTTSNEECGDNSAAGSVQEAETNNQKHLSEDTLAAKHNIPEKYVETNGDFKEEPTSTSDVPSSVKDNEGNGDSTANQKPLSQEVAAKQNEQEKNAEPTDPAPEEEPTSTSDIQPSVKDNKGNGEPTTYQKPSPQEVAEEQNVRGKNVEPTDPALEEEPTSTSDVPSSVKDNEGNGDSTPNRKSLSQEVPEQQNVRGKNVETTDPAPKEEPTSTSDAPPCVKDNEGNGDSTTNQKPLSQEVAAEQNVREKNVKPTDAVSEEEPTSTSDVPPSVEDDEGNGESRAYQTLLSQEVAAGQNVRGKTVHRTDPALKEEPKPTPDIPPNVKDYTRRNLLIGVALVALAAVLLQQLLQPKSPPQTTSPRQIDIFHQEMDKVKVQFPSQREELWKRSRIHLQRHFQISQQTEPVSIILTAGVRAEVTLHCLAQSIASALSSALNVSAIHIDGASKSSQDSDKVKSDIDSQLQGAFEGGKPIAVIHRFEELPPASTLIFYRYCDHENAAFKKTFLIFTVLLGEEEEIQANIRLREIEEMVTDHLQKKFLSNGHPTSFDKMDIDKYGGLWSRISHLILPVVTEKKNCKN